MLRHHRPATSVLRAAASFVIRIIRTVAEPTVAESPIVVPVATPDLSRHRSIMVIDIESSTARPDSTKGQSRRVMYKIVDKSFRVSGIASRHIDLHDRGDGILALVHPVDQAPTALLLNPFVTTLSRLLTEHNTNHPDHQFRLRVVVHAGEVLYDNRGCFGETLDIAFRLLDSPEVKRRLRETKESLVLVVSDYIYQSIIRHRYHGIDEKGFEPLACVQVAGQQHRGWIYVPARTQSSDLQD